MADKKAKDEISRLLDSYQEDDALEAKMEGFAARKRTQAKKYQEPVEIKESDRLNDTVVISAKDTKRDQTMMFDPEHIEEEQENSNKTVVIDDNEIQSLLEEEGAPKLRREVVSKSRPSKKPSHKKKKGLSPGAIVGIVMAVVVVLGLIGFGVYSFLNPSSQEPKTEETTKAQERAYDRIIEWIDGVFDEDYSDIVDYEKDYNSLTKKQKRELNRYFEDVTGSTFDELLAKEKSGDKKDSSNNNAKIAELKAQLSSLNDQLTQAQSTLRSANEDLTARQNEYNQLNTQYQEAVEANNEVLNIQNEMSAMETRRQELLNKQAEQTITQEELIELNNIYAEWPELNDQLEQAQKKANNYPDLNTLQTQINSASAAVTNAQAAVNDAQSTVDQLTSSIREVEHQIEALD